MQKTFNVWVKNGDWEHEFQVCSKKIERKLRLIEIGPDDEIIDFGAEIRGCDVSQWLETLNLKQGEVIEAQVTFKFK